MKFPAHSHSYNFVVKEGRGVKADATNSWLAESNLFRDSGTITGLNNQTTNNTGNAQPHTNMQPYLAVTYCIALQGVFPSRN